MNNITIYYVEDDDEARELLSLNLEQAGYKVFSFFSAEQASKHLKVNPPANNNESLFLLDIMLPGESGIEFAMHLRQEGSQIPFIFITALGQEKLISKAYEIGAIDFIIKPIQIDNLLAKIKNIMSHITHSNLNKPNQIGEATIDWKLLSVTRNKETTLLSNREKTILEYFLSHPDTIIERKKLIQISYGNDQYASSRSIDNIIVKLRKLFERNPASPKRFITYPKQGYAYITKKPKEEI